jgi:hypothetical protein
MPVVEMEWDRTRSGQRVVPVACAVGIAGAI